MSAGRLAGRFTGVGSADRISSVLTAAARVRRFALVVRGSLLVTAMGMGILLWQASALGLMRVLTVGAIACLLLAVRRPELRWQGGCWVLVPVRVLMAPPPWPVMVVVVGLVWLAHRLVCWAAIAPAHAEVGPAAVGLLLRDAAVELAWLVGLGGVLALGLGLGAELPGGGWWAASLLVAGLVGVVVARRP